MPTYNELYLGRMFCPYIRMKITFHELIFYIVTIPLWVGYDSVQYNDLVKVMSGQFCTMSEYFFPEKQSVQKKLPSFEQMND